jgi:DNA invertase Pin-like site-specific DNA recombinase
MSSSNSTNGAVRAACLYRNSDDKQENSVDRQRDGVVPYARKKGYEAVAEYVFDGIPGDLINDHPTWKRLLRDAQAGLWSVLLVDEPSRLSRELPEDFIGDVYRPLKRAQITVDSVAKGVQDWQSLAGLIMTAIDAHRSSQEVRDLAHRSLGGILKQARAGRWFGGMTPYGLRVRREATDPGTPEMSAAGGSWGRRRNSWPSGSSSTPSPTSAGPCGGSAASWRPGASGRRLAAAGARPPSAGSFATASTRATPATG